MGENKIYNILFCGIGGQGVLTASEVAGWAGIFDGFDVKKSEVHGMAQRGGSVESHLRIGKKIYSPLIPDGQADFIVPFYKDEHDRLKFFLKKNGIDLLDSLVRAEKELGNEKLVNTYLLGVLSKHLPLSEASWIKAMEKTFTRFLDENIEIFKKGRNEK